MNRKIATAVVCTLISCVAISLVGCTAGTKEKADEPKPLNISIYLDLSDRLVVNSGMVPSQKEKDLAIVDVLTDYFTSKNQGTAILKSKDRMRVFFYPTPQDPEVYALSEALTVDMSKYATKDRLDSLKNLKQRFNATLSKIYDLTIKEEKWVGSDIWGFFSDKSKVDVQCIDKDARNIVIILTDGFIYHEDNVIQDGDAFSYVSTTTLSNSKSSLIVKRDGLDDIEVLVLEITPKPIQKDKMVSVLNDWFTAMGVQKVEIYETDITTNIKTAIDKFLDDDE